MNKKSFLISVIYKNNNSGMLRDLKQFFNYGRYYELKYPI